MSRSEDNNHVLGIVGGFLSTISLGCAYSSYRSSTVRDTILKTPYTSIKDVSGLLVEGKPIYLKIQGAVETDFPLTAELSGEKAAAYEKETKGVWYSLGWLSDQSNNEYSVEVLRRESPYYIKDSNQKIYLKPFEPKQPKLEKVHIHEEKAGNPFVSLILGSMKFHYPYKYVHTERILPIGRNLLVLGDLYKQHDGTLRVFPPNTKWFFPTNPGIQTLQSEEEVVQKLNADISSKTVAAAIFGSFGLAFIAASFR